MDVCREAGKRFVFDGFSVRQRIKTGRVSLESVKKTIAERGFGFVDVDPKADMSTFRAAATIWGPADVAAGHVLNEGAEWGVARGIGTGASFETTACAQTVPDHRCER